MSIVGHWDSLAEAQKLVQSVLLKGVIQETINEGQLLPKLPVTGITGKSLLYNRESTLPSAAFYDIHEQIPWKADVAYATQVEVELKRVVRQDVLDNFIQKNYKNPNDYRTIVLSELRKGCMNTIETKLIYGDATTYPKEFNGIWKLRATDMLLENHAAGAALSLAKLRMMLDLMRYKVDVLLMPRALRRRFDAAYQESLGAANAWITWGINQIGERVPYFAGIPIMHSDYMTMTEGDSAPTGASNGSIFALHFGQIDEGGLAMVVGADTGGPDLFNVVELDTLEDYDAAGIRLVAYLALGLGSTKALGQLCNITDAAVTA